MNQELIVYVTDIDFKTPKKTSHKEIIDLTKDIGNNISKVIPSNAYFHQTEKPEGQMVYFLQHHYLRNSPTKVSEFVCIKPEFTETVSKNIEGLLNEIQEKVENKKFELNSITQTTIPVTDIMGCMSIEKAMDKYWGKRIHLPVIDYHIEDVNKAKALYFISMGVISGILAMAYFLK